jgi:hypothetical protein
MLQQRHGQWCEIVWIYLVFCVLYTYLSSLITEINEQYIIISPTRKYMNAETLAFLTKPLYFPNMKYPKLLFNSYKWKIAKKYHF